MHVTVGIICCKKNDPLEYLLFGLDLLAIAAAKRFLEEDCLALKRPE